MNQAKKENTKFNNDGQVFEFFKNARNIAIRTADDQKCLNSGVALSMYLKENFKKDAYLVYLGDLESIDPVYAEYAEIKPYFAGKRVKLTIDYSNTKVQSLSWERTSENSLIMEMGPVNRNFDQSRLKFETLGDDVGLIITIGYESLESIGDFYINNKSEFENSNIINIDTNARNKRFGNVNIVKPKTDSIISLVLRQFVEWNYTPTAQISSILLYGLQKHLNESSSDEPVEVGINNNSSDSQL